MIAPDALNSVAFQSRAIAAFHIYEDDRERANNVKAHELAIELTAVIGEPLSVIKVGDQWRVSTGLFLFDRGDLEGYRLLSECDGGCGAAMVHGNFTDLATLGRIMYHSERRSYAFRWKCENCRKGVTV